MIGTQESMSRSFDREIESRLVIMSISEMWVARGSGMFEKHSDDPRVGHNSLFEKVTFYYFVI